MITAFIELVQKNGLESLVADNLSGLCKGGMKLLPEEEIGFTSDLVVAFGGDGTFLAAARAVGSSGTPIFGVNAGRLGFLTEVSPEELESGFAKILAGDFEIEKRIVLEAWVNNSEDAKFRALNDIVVEKWTSSRIIEIESSADGKPVNVYTADGLIVATPTGSTAYSLAAGGPIVHPSLNALILTPICPHSVSVRPIVFPGEMTLSICVRSDHGHMMLTADGQKGCQLVSGDCVYVKKTSYTINIIKLQGRTFYDLLRTKLTWGTNEKKF